MVGCWTCDREVVSSTLGRVGIKWLAYYLSADIRQTVYDVGIQHQGQLSLPSIWGR